MTRLADAREVRQVIAASEVNRYHMVNLSGMDQAARTTDSALMTIALKGFGSHHLPLPRAGVP